MSFLKKVKTNVALFFIFLSIFLLTNTLTLSSNEVNLDFDIIIPIDPQYDENTLKKLGKEFLDDIFTDTTHTTLKTPTSVLAILDDGNQKYPESSNEYMAYEEIYDTYISDGVMLVDSDGYYYPTLTLFIGGGDSDDIITLSLTLTEYYLIESSGTVSQTGVGTPYARIYSAIVDANNFSGKNIKYEISYRSYDTVMDDSGVTHDVYHVVTSADGYNSWLRFEDVIIADPTIQTSDYTAIVNALSRVYHTDAPFYDNSLKKYIWPYYQEIDKLSLIPITPEDDNDYFTVTKKSTGAEVTNFSLVNDTENFNVLVEGVLLEPNAVYFDFVNSTLSVEPYELDSVQAEIYISDGSSDSYSGTPIMYAANLSLTGILHHFSFYTDYEMLLDEMTANNSDSFDVVLTGKSKRLGDDGNQISVTVILDDIKLPRVTLNSIKVTNETTKNLWNSMGLDSTAYSTADFTATAGDVSLVRDDNGKDGNYAKLGDSISIYLDYDAVYDSRKHSFDSGICLLYGSKVANLTSTGQTYTTTLSSTFSGNGIAYLVLKNATDVSSILGYEKNRTEILYIDNTEATDEVMSLSSTNRYIKDDSKLLYSSNEDAGFDPNSTTRSTTKINSGLSGTRAYLNIFAYDSTKSDAEMAGLTGLEPHTSLQYNSQYYRVVDESSKFSESITLDGHNNDGEYTVRKLIAIDKAGNISTVNKNIVSAILDELCSSPLTDSIYDYHVDTIAPTINYVAMEKTADANGLPLSGMLPFKGGDTLNLSVSFEEYSPYSYSVSQLAPSLGSGFPKTETGITGSTVTVGFTVGNYNASDDTGSGHSFGNITVSDKAGNTTTSDITGELYNTPPDSVYPETYESLVGWGNSGINGIEDLNIDGTYWFSKGSSISGENKPVFLLKFTGDISKVAYADITVNGTNNFKAYNPSTSMVNIAAVDTDIYLQPNSVNTVLITPYTTSGKEGSTLSKNIVIDNSINSSSTDKLNKTATYNAATGKYQFEIDLSKVSELAGLKGYKVVGVKSKVGSYASISTPTVEYPTGDSDLGSSYGNHMELSTTSSTTLTSASIVKNIKISKDDLFPGSKSTLVVSVIDKLGSQENLEINFLIPNPGLKLKARTGSSNRVMVSNVKMVGETNQDKGFEIESLEETVK